MRVSIEPLSMDDPRLGGPYEAVRSLVVTPSYITLDQGTCFTQLPTDGRVYSVWVQEDQSLIVQLSKEK